VAPAAAIESDPDQAALASDSVTAEDIRAACLSVVAQSDLAEERGAAEFRAALHAIRAAGRRHTSQT
jgi:hypothetical protein